MTSLSEGDEDLHYGNGQHRRRPPLSVPSEQTAAWRARSRAHVTTHRVNGDAHKVINDEITLEIRR